MPLILTLRTKTSIPIEVDTVGLDCLELGKGEILLPSKEAG